MRQLASSLASAVFLVDPQGTLVFYNEHAEPILGRRYEETGPMPVELWTTMFHPLDQRGKPLAPESLPLVKVLKTNKPASKVFWIRALDGVKRKIEVTAFPLIGQTHKLVGAVSMFTEVTSA
jgi:PAS domain-containing protein